MSVFVFENKLSHLVYSWLKEHRADKLAWLVKIAEEARKLETGEAYNAELDKSWIVNGIAGSELPELIGTELKTPDGLMEVLLQDVLETLDWNAIAQAAVEGVPA